MIDERRQEQACVYAIGALPADELREFESFLSLDAELWQFTYEMRASTKALVASVPQFPAPAGLKQRVMASVQPGGSKIVQFEPAPRSPWASLFPWAVAACLAGLCAALAVQIKRVTTEGDSLRLQLADLQTTAQEKAREYERVSEQASLLGKEVDRLKAENNLAEMRISMLNSLLEDQPKAIAVSVWDQKKQSGVFVVHNLKAPAPDRDYQLWVIDAKAPVPVDAGVFQVDKDGNVRIEFKPHAAIAIPDKFAVTDEPKGGRPTPTGKTIMVGS